VTEIAIAGRSLERAAQAAKEIGDMPVATVAVQVDGTDEEKLASAMAGYDLIVNAAATKAVLPAIRAAARTGAHYCDVASFGNSVKQALSLAPEAKAAGITAIIATGISPNITNLMGVHVARQLEEVAQLQLGRPLVANFQSGRELTPRQWLADPGESVVALQEFKGYITWMLRILQKNGIRTMLDCRDGQWVEVDPIRSGVDAPHLMGGTVRSYPYMSCDSFWGCVPQDLSTVSPVELYFSPFPPPLHDVLVKQALRVAEGDTDPESAVNAFYEMIGRDPQRWLTLPDDYTPMPVIWLRAVGRKEGRAARCSCWFTAPMWDVSGYLLTSIPLAVAALQILRGKVRERGILTGEKAFEPLPFLEDVAAMLPEPPPDGRLIDESFEWLE
jgi:hypothetical protein